MPRQITGPGNPHTLLMPDARKCPKCGKPTHRWEDIGDIEEKIELDWSTTDDSFEIVSTKFKEITESVGVADVKFHSLSNGSYVFQPLQYIFLDMSEKLIAKGPCWTCGRLTQLIGDTWYPRILPGQKTLGPTEIARSAQTFTGQDFFYEPSIFGDEIFDAMTYEGLRDGIGWYNCPQVA